MGIAKRPTVRDVVLTCPRADGGRGCPRRCPWEQCAICEFVMWKGSKHPNPRIQAASGARLPWTRSQPRRSGAGTLRTSRVYYLHEHNSFLFYLQALHRVCPQLYVCMAALITIALQPCRFCCGPRDVIYSIGACQARSRTSIRGPQAFSISDAKGCLPCLEDGVFSVLSMKASWECYTCLESPCRVSSPLAPSPPTALRAGGVTRSRLAPVMPKPHDYTLHATIFAANLTSTRIPCKAVAQTPTRLETSPLQTSWLVFGRRELSPT
jgi:hypothetical protein